MVTSRTLPLFPSLSVPDRDAPIVRPAPARRPPGPEPRSRPNVAQLWLALHFPRLALDALKDALKDAQNGRTLAVHGREQSIAILDPEDRVQSVLACNDLARARGVRAGQPLNAALAFDSALITLPRDAFRERQFLERIAAHCHRFTPLVSLAGADELLLEVKGSLRLFGGARALVDRLTGELRAQDVEVGPALTPTPQSALWLARSRRGEWPCVQRPEDLAAQLARVPLACLRWPAEVIERLVNMGVRGIGDLVRLPRAGLARRIGPQWLDELDRAFGRRAEVRRRFEPRERYLDAQALDCEIETVAGLKAALEPLLARLQRFLRVREAALGTLVLELEHRTGPETRVRLGLAAPTGDVNHLHGLLQERLASLALRAPVIAVRLRSGALRAVPAVSARLPYALSSASAVLPDALPRLIERLQARLGREAVFGVSTFAEHRPELAWRAVEMSAADQASGHPAHGHRPVWLLAEPQPAEVSRWCIESGPERIESGWWDGCDVARDYFIARDPHGARCWVYRECRAPRRWFLHGLFG